MNKAMPTSSDILFLKRLLYLKASIDNEATLNTFSVPFEQEKMRDVIQSNEHQIMQFNQGAMSSNAQSVGDSDNMKYPSEPM